MSFVGAIVAGLVATGVFTVTTRLTTVNQMGWERYLRTLFTDRDNSALGFALHFAIGVLIAILYAALWSVGIGWPDYLYGFIFGILQWIIAGALVGAMPFVHAGIRAGTVPPPGLYMTNLLGGWAVLGGLVNHVIFGLAVAFFYQFFRSRYG